MDAAADTAWCPTKLNWDGTPRAGHWATCECDVQKDAVYVARETAPSTSTSTCDDVYGFRDADGESCVDYVRKAYCNADGSYGAHWMQGETFDDYANAKGLTAPTACCGCGGGTAARPSSSVVNSVVEEQ